MGVIRDTFNALFKGKIFNTEINQYKLKEQYGEALETRSRTSTAIGSLEDTKEDKSNKSQANGYPSLDADGKIPSTQIGDISGNSPTATKLITARKIGIATGDIESVGSDFDGSADNSNVYTIKNNIITNGKLSDMPINTIKASLLGGSPQDVTLSDMKIAMNTDKVDNTSDVDKMTVVEYTELNTVNKNIVDAINEVKTNSENSVSDINDNISNVDNTSDLIKVKVNTYNDLNTINKTIIGAINETIVTDSTMNGNIKIAGTENEVYRHPNHSGDVTSTSDGVTVISTNIVTNTKLAQMPTMTIKGNKKTTTGNAQDLTITEAQNMIFSDDKHLPVSLVEKIQWSSTGSLVKFYNTVAEMQADSANITEGMTIQLLGYHSKNDGAGHYRKIGSTDLGFGIQVGILWANIIETSEINANEIGFVGDGLTDNRNIFELFKLTFPDSILSFKDGDYYFAETTTRMDFSGVSIKGTKNTTFSTKRELANTKDLSLLTPIIFKNKNYNLEYERPQNINYVNYYQKISNNILNFSDESEKWELKTWLDFQGFHLSSYSGSIVPDSTHSIASDDKLTFPTTFATGFKGMQFSIRNGEYLECVIKKPNTTNITNKRVGCILRTSGKNIFFLNTPKSNLFEIFYYNVGVDTKISLFNKNMDENNNAYKILDIGSNIFGIKIKNKTTVEFYCNSVFLFEYDFLENIRVACFSFENTDNNLYEMQNPMLAYNIKKKKNIKIAVFGDSIAYGQWSSIHFGKLMKDILIFNGFGEIEVDIFAVPGAITSDQLTVINNTDLNSYDYTLIYCGTNDVQASISVLTVSNNLLAMANKALADGSIPIVGDLYTWGDSENTGYGVNTASNDRISIFNSYIKKTMLSNNILLANVSFEISDSLNWIYDLLHAGEKGQIAMCKAYLKKIFEKENEKMQYLKDITNQRGYITEYSSSAPSSGYHTVGDRVKNSNPIAGGYEGWVCITSGIPGTWKGFGLIQA